MTTTTETSETQANAENPRGAVLLRHDDHVHTDVIVPLSGDVVEILRCLIMGDGSGITTTLDDAPYCDEDGNFVVPLAIYGGTNDEVEEFIRRSTGNPALPTLWLTEPDPLALILALIAGGI